MQGAVFQSWLATLAWFGLTMVLTQTQFPPTARTAARTHANVISKTGE